MTAVRAAVAAGSFYPGRPGELAALVDRLLDAAKTVAVEGRLRALVVPHAGYGYSGSVAANAFALVRGRGALRVGLLGPSHFSFVERAAVTEADVWRTPLGDVPVDDDLRSVALAAGAAADELAHLRDHALEVELPFFQRCVGDLAVTAIALGDDDSALVGALAEHALVVVSTDLSHYHDAATARRLDRRTADAVLALDDTSIRDDAACGAAALRSLVHHAREAGWSCTLLDLRSSADATGETRRVVGYGSFGFTS